MDINSPRGRQTLHDERQAVDIWHSRYPAVRYCETPKHLPARLDAVLIHRSEVYAVVETKCRYDMTFVQLITTREARWMISFDKVCRGQTVSLSLGVPFLGFLYLPAQEILIVTRITDENGDIVCNMTVSDRLTQRTVNGGTNYKTVALIDLENAKVLRRTKT
jgi:hypothetical protein